MNDNELARIYFDHHAEETDRRSQRRLTELMRRAKRHDDTCSDSRCPIKLRSFLHGDAIVHTRITDELMRHGYLEHDQARRHVVADTGFFVRVYFPQHRHAVTGLVKP